MKGVDDIRTLTSLDRVRKRTQEAAVMLDVTFRDANPYAAQAVALLEDIDEDRYDTEADVRRSEAQIAATLALAFETFRMRQGVGR